MATSRERSPESLWGQFVPLLALFPGVTGAVLVLGKVRGSSGPLMPLVDGAWIGGLIALVVAVGFVVTLPIRARRDTRGAQAVISFALAAVTVLSLVVTTRRLEAGEATDDRVTQGIIFYAITVALQLIAGVTGAVLAKRTRDA